jgi:hypothetical protein
MTAYFRNAMDNADPSDPGNWFADPNMVQPYGGVPNDGDNLFIYDHCYLGNLTGIYGMVTVRPSFFGDTAATSLNNSGWNCHTLYIRDGVYSEWFVYTSQVSDETCIGSIGAGGDGVRFYDGNTGSNFQGGSPIVIDGPWLIHPAGSTYNAFIGFSCGIVIRNNPTIGPEDGEPPHRCQIALANDIDLTVPVTFRNMVVSGYNSSPESPIITVNGPNQNPNPNTTTRTVNFNDVWFTNCNLVLKNDWSWSQNDYSGTSEVTEYVYPGHLRLEVWVPGIASHLTNTQPAFVATYQTANDLYYPQTGFVSNYTVPVERGINGSAILATM